jgi:hypothetical protein
MESLFPTLKRGANQLCASSAFFADIPYAVHGAAEAAPFQNYS